MCPPGHHHSGFMATPALGHRMCGYTLKGLHCGVTRVLELQAVSEA